MRLADADGGAKEDDAAAYTNWSYPYQRVAAAGPPKKARSRAFVASPPRHMPDLIEAETDEERMSSHHQPGSSAGSSAVTAADLNVGPPPNFAPPPPPAIVAAAAAAAATAAPAAAAAPTTSPPTAGAANRTTSMAVRQSEIYVSRGGRPSFLITPSDIRSTYAESEAPVSPYGPISPLARGDISYSLEQISEEYVSGESAYLSYLSVASEAIADSRIAYLDELNECIMRIHKTCETMLNAISKDNDYLNLLASFIVFPELARNLYLEYITLFRLGWDVYPFADEVTRKVESVLEKVAEPQERSLDWILKRPLARLRAYTCIYKKLLQLGLQNDVSYKSEADKLQKAHDKIYSLLRLARARFSEEKRRVSGLRRRGHCIVSGLWAEQTHKEASTLEAELDFSRVRDVKTLEPMQSFAFDVKAKGSQRPCLIVARKALSFSMFHTTTQTMTQCSHVECLLTSDFLLVTAVVREGKPRLMFPPLPNDCWSIAKEEKSSFEILVYGKETMCFAALADAASGTAGEDAREFIDMMHGVLAQNTDRHLEGRIAELSLSQSQRSLATDSLLSVRTSFLGTLASAQSKRQTSKTALVPSPIMEEFPDLEKKDPEKTLADSRAEAEATLDGRAGDTSLDSELAEPNGDKHSSEEAETGDKLASLGSQRSVNSNGSWKPLRLSSSRSLGASSSGMSSSGFSASQIDKIVEEEPENGEKAAEGSTSSTEAPEAGKAPGEEAGGEATQTQDADNETSEEVQEADDAASVASPTPCLYDAGLPSINSSPLVESPRKWARASILLPKAGQENRALLLASKRLSYGRSNKSGLTLMSEGSPKRNRAMDENSMDLYGSPSRKRSMQRRSIDMKKQPARGVGHDKFPAPPRQGLVLDRLPPPSMMREAYSLEKMPIVNGDSPRLNATPRKAPEGKTLSPLNSGSSSRPSPESSVTSISAESNTSSLGKAGVRRAASVRKTVQTPSKTRKRSRMLSRFMAFGRKARD